MQLNGGSSISITHNGYLYVWVSNESNGNVYFDDIRVDFQQGPLLEENHFYPYGLKMTALSSKAFGSLFNKFQYQGSYSEFDDETGYNEFALRTYDPQLGRWTGVDPYDQFSSPYTGMGNNPTNNVDPSGGDIDGGFLEPVTVTSSYASSFSSSFYSALQATGMIASTMFDDWYRNNQGQVVYDKNVHRQADLLNLNGTSRGQYLGQEYQDVNENDGSSNFYNADGSQFTTVSYLPSVSIGTTIKSIGAPGTYESIVPVWGSGRAAINDFQTGHWGYGLLQTALAISDVFLVKSAFTAVGKIVAKSVAETTTRTIVKDATIELTSKSVKTGVEETAVHGNSLKSLKPTWGYRLYSQDGTFLKNGITSRLIPESRYTKAFMSDKYMEAIPFPNRLEAYQWEFQQNQILPGPLNFNMH